MVGIIILKSLNCIPHYYSFLMVAHRYWEGRGETSQFLPSPPSYLKQEEISSSRHKKHQGFINYQ